MMSAIEKQILPGPYKINPADGNAYREEYRIETRGNVVITDALGGHEMTITIDEWGSWPETSVQEILTTNAAPRYVLGPSRRRTSSKAYCKTCAWERPGGSNVNALHIEAERHALQHGHHVTVKENEITEINGRTELPS